MPNAPQRHHRKGHVANRDDRRNSFDRGYDTKWNKLRNIFIQDNPICVGCKPKGWIVAARIVDHIIPVHVAPERRLDVSNLQSLCRTCHTIKTNEDLTKYGAAK